MIDESRACVQLKPKPAYIPDSEADNFFGWGKPGSNDAETHYKFNISISYTYVVDLARTIDSVRYELHENQSIRDYIEFLQGDFPVSLDSKTVVCLSSHDDLLRCVWVCVFCHRICRASHVSLTSKRTKKRAIAWPSSQGQSTTCSGQAGRTF